LEDAGDGHTDLSGVAHRACCGAPGEALQLEIDARAEDVERF
jgi:hypothetical protein